MKKYLMGIVSLTFIGLVVYHSGCSQSREIFRAEPNEPETTPVKVISPLSICSFNIQFLGNFKKKDNETLSQILKDYDIVVVQELVAPPIEGDYPDGSAYSADPEAATFLQAMQNKGFRYILSEEDTGTGDTIHLASTATEWWITFYKPSRVDYAPDLPHGFLAEDRSNNDFYERVPYAFSFRTLDNHLDFVLISVHFNPGDSNSDQERRREELGAIVQWIDLNDQQEKDFIILGDMNIKDNKELLGSLPEGYISLNDECYPTNTTPSSPKPYDHVMYRPRYSTEIDTQWDFVVVNLMEAVKPYWTGIESFPGDPYVHDLFRQYYSDHHPIVFRMNIPLEDDD